MSSMVSSVNITYDNVCGSLLLLCWMKHTNMLAEN